MEERKIYPIIINRTRLTDYYNMLFEKGFQLKVLRKEKMKIFMITFYL